MRFVLFAALLLSGAMPALGADLVLRAAPDQIYAYQANAQRGYADIMVQTVALTGGSERAVELASLRLDYKKAGETLASKMIPAAILVKDTAEYAAMAEQGFDGFLRAQILNADGLEAFAGKGASLSKDTSLARGETLLATGLYAALSFVPDEVVVTAAYKAAGRTKSAALTIPVRQHSSSIKYAFPLDGVWLERALPSLASHHRWVPGSEFAVDFFKTGPDGAAYEDDRNKVENHYGYGALVHAAAPGDVVFVIADEVQDRDALSKHDDETIAEASRRITNYNMRRIMRAFRRALAGNIVTIRHVGPDGETEYSSYGHLKAGSVRVAVGGHVSQGEVIGAVGDTGDSAAVHLHFQINAGADAFFSPSIPARFEDLQETFIGADPGVYVRGAGRGSPE